MMIRYWMCTTDGFRSEHKFLGTQEECMNHILLKRLAGCVGWELYDTDMTVNDFFDYERKQKHSVTSWYDKGAISKHPLKKDPKK